MNLNSDNPAVTGKFATPGSSLFSNGKQKKHWYLQSCNDKHQVAGADICAPEAWEITRGKRKIVVAIIDGGFDLSHPDLNLPGKIVFPTNYVKEKKYPAACGISVSNHGTMCAGVAVAEGKAQGMIGVAPGCSLMPVSVSPDASDATLVKVFTETSQRADVICCCWSPPPGYAPLSSSLYRTLKTIAEKGGPRKKGVVICFSASNYNAHVDDPDSRQFFWFDRLTGSIRITSGPVLNGFAAHPSVIAVSAYTSLNQKAAYSNWGKEISVCAPSNNFHPLVQSSRVKGRTGIWTTDSLSTQLTKNNGYTGNFGGTSCAAAIVAGVAGLVLSANGTLTATQVKIVLEETADKIIDKDPDIILGNEKGTYVNGHSQWFGYGKVNAANAVRQAKKMLEANSFLVNNF